MVVITTILAGTAAASHDGTDAPRQLTPQAQSEVAQSGTESAPGGSASQTQPPPALDRRDRIFYPGDTERPKPLIRKLTLNILLDQEDIFTSPFHIDRHNAWAWLLSGAATGGLIAADRHIADSFENSRGQVRWGGRISNISTSYSLIPIVAGSYVYGAWRDNAKAREIGVLGTESLLDSLIVVEILKAATRRNRPDEKNPGEFWGGGTSFPSGHSIQVWSIASLLAHEYKRKKIVQVTAYHKHSSLMPFIVPQVWPSQRSYGVALVFGGAGPTASIGPMTTSYGLTTLPGVPRLGF